MNWSCQDLSYTMGADEITKAKRMKKKSQGLALRNLLGKKKKKNLIGKGCLGGSVG